MQDTRVEGFQLSPQQRHLWAMHGDDTSAPYITHGTVRIRGAVDPDALQHVLRDLSARHEILRTTFCASREMSVPLQVVGPASEDGIVIEAGDLSALDRDERDRAVDAYRERAAGRALDPARGPLAQVSLLTVSADEHVLLIRLPALCCDARGLDNLVVDICRCYEAQVSAVQPPEPPLQYVDTSIWLNEALTSAESAIGRKFWSSQDDSSIARPRLPFEARRPAGRSFQPKSIALHVPPATIDGMRALVADATVSGEAFLVTCWQCLVQKTTGDPRMAVGVQYDGRGYAELENAIGLLARTLPLSGTLPDTLAFRDALVQVDEGIRSARQWGECFEWNVAGDLVQGMSEAPFVPFVFEQRYAPTRHHANDVVFEIEEWGTCIDRFKLKLAWTSGNGQADCALEYDGQLYCDEDARRTAAQLETLMADAIRRPLATLAELRMVADSELRLARDASPVTSACVHHLFEAQVAATPANPAVCCESERLTYAELNERANQLARVLQKRGVGPETAVALSLGRSVDMIVGILGILKAGGAYVPLDPQLPMARLGVMLADSGATLLVTVESLLDALPRPGDVVLLDRDRSLIEAEATENPTSPTGPEHLAYILFTSGSTGRPKGVAVEHRQLATYTRSIGMRLDLPAAASYATVTTVAADLGNTAIYPALLSGGCLHVITDTRASDPGAFADYCARHPIDVLKIVPSHLKALLSTPHPAAILPRMRLVLGGEACSWDLVEEIRRLAPACVVFNHYGPTETTVGATTYRADEAIHSATATVPIGYPLPHVTAYALDGYQRPVPPWVAGELYIGGSGVARGYVNAPDLTSQRFIADPFSTTPGARLYRTGDLVRQLPTGELEFVGRIDRQVKIRGFRVELGEVEATLRRHPAVDDASVVVREDDAGERRLAAFFVCRNGARPDPTQLRSYLAGELPEYMVPGSLVPLDALPLTPNGKVDLTALAELPATASTAASDGEPPQSAWEQTVAAIWHELLQTDDVHANDNFYDLGGHSLMAMQVVSVLEKRTGVRVGPRDLLFHTLRQFAALCEAKMAVPERPAAT